jgi:hypothetical protein
MEAVMRCSVLLIVIVPALVLGEVQAPGPGLLGGVIPVAYNRIAMLTDYIDPNQHWGVCPNQDVVYGFGYFGCLCPRWIEGIRCAVALSVGLFR